MGNCEIISYLLAMQIFFPYTVVIIINRWQYQFFIEHEIEIFAVHNPHQDRMFTPSTEVIFIGLSYALLVW